MNHVTIDGRLTRDIEVRYSAKGNAVASFSVAVNEKYNGNETTTFVDVTAFGKTAESMPHAKGSLVCVVGRLKQEEWTDKQSGQQRRKLVVIADRVYVASNGGVHGRANWT